MPSKHQRFQVTGAIFNRTDEEQSSSSRRRVDGSHDEAFGDPMYKVATGLDRKPDNDRVTEPDGLGTKER